MALRFSLFLVSLLAAGSASVADVTIHTMIAGSQALDLEWTRQLTSRSDGCVSSAAMSPDGKSIAYVTSADGQDSLCLIKSSGGGPKRVMTSTEEEAGGRRVRWKATGLIAWSPDSRSFALSAMMHYCDARPPDSPLIEDFILVYAVDGSAKASFSVGKQFHMISRPEILVDSIVFSPDSRRLAVGRRRALSICDIASGEATEVPAPDGYLCLEAWRDSRSILCMAAGGPADKASLVRVPLNGGPAKTLIPEHPDRYSPDFRFRVVTDDGNVTVEDLHTGAVGQPLPVSERDFLGWLPNSRMFIYSQGEKISDNRKIRTRQLSTLWAASLAGGKLNTMCVATDCQGTRFYDRKASWSANCTRAAYISNDCLYSLELSVREPSAKEKSAAGLAARL